MNTVLKKSTCRQPFQWTLCLALGLSAILTLSASFASAENDLTVRVYSCAPGQAPALADRLRTDFGLFDGVRIAADDRTSQVIVQAPAEIQTRIGQRMAPAAPANGSRPSDTRDTAATQSRSVTLRYATGEQVDRALVSILGSRIAAMPSVQSSTKRYRVSLPAGQVHVAINATNSNVDMEGGEAVLGAFVRLIQVLDSPSESNGRDVRVLPLKGSPSTSVLQVADVVRTAGGRQPPSVPLAATLFRPREDATAAAQQPRTPGPSPAVKPGEGKGRGGLLGPVQIENLNGLDVLVLRGNTQDVEQVMDIINQIERLSVETKPKVELLSLRHVDCLAMATLVGQIYDGVFLSRQGDVSITPLVKPNSILIVGKSENVRTVMDLIERLDQPVDPDTQFHVFHLKYAAAATVQGTVQQFYQDRSPTDRASLKAVVRVIADARSNALIVQAAPRDMAEVAELIHRLDTSTSAAVNEVRIIQLKHSSASDIASILTQAIGASTGGRTTQSGSTQPGGYQPGGSSATRQQNDQRAAMLRFMTVDAEQRKLLNSGILSDVNVTADARANALVISAPPENLDLLEAIIRRLDDLPAAEAQIKVFTIVNGDAKNLQATLEMLFLQQTQSVNSQPSMMPSTGSGSSSVSTIVPLRFAIDSRTNSIIACGSKGDLAVVEAILTRLDDNVRNRKSVVIRLKNAPATQVSQTINTFLTTERQVEQQSPGMTSAFEQIEREVVVVPETVSNSLVLSATPRFFDEIKAIIDQLDARPPMVMIQVLIAQIDLGNTNEFGVELGLQDSVLFDRSSLQNIQNGAVTLPNGTTTQSVVSAEGNPGFNFNNTNPLGNNSSGNLMANAVGGQSIANFGVGRGNPNLGYSGLVLSLASENVSALIRALAENHRIEVLQRPQIMTLDNQPAYIQVGQSVPTITTVTATNNGITNGVEQKSVGLIMQVTPRISPDGLVVMQIDAVKSALEPEANGIPIYASNGGTVIRSPIIDQTMAQTTVSAMSEQTVVLGGLISKIKNETHRKVPLLGDVPLLGHLFRYDSTTNSRTELLIIMTPHIVKNEAEANAIKQVEAGRMSWCLSDVTAIHGEAGLRKRCDNWSDAETKVIYPDLKYEPGSLPAETEVKEQVPTPAGTPNGRPPLPPPSANPPRQPSLRGPAVMAPNPDAIRPIPASNGDAEQESAAAELRRRWIERQAQSPANGSMSPQGEIQPAIYQQQPVNANVAQPMNYQQPVNYPPQPNYQQPQQQQPNYQQPVQQPVYQQPIYQQPVQQQPVQQQPYQSAR